MNELQLIVQLRGLKKEFGAGIKDYLPLVENIIDNDKRYSKCEKAFLKERMNLHLKKNIRDFHGGNLPTAKNKVCNKKPSGSVKSN